MLFMKKTGFSLIEVLVALVLVGIAIASLVAGSISFTKVTGTDVELTTAEFLIEQIRELTILLPVIDPETGTDTFGPEPDEAALSDYDDLDDFDNFDTAVFPAPIDAERNPLEHFSAYSQQITVENVSPSNFEQPVGDHYSSFVRITVKILLNSEEILSTDWIRAQY